MPDIKNAEPPQTVLSSRPAPSAEELGNAALPKLDDAGDSAEPAATPKKSDPMSGALGALVFGAILFKIWVWDNLPSPQWQVGVLVGTLLVLLIGAMVLWKWSKGQEALGNFLDKTGLASTLLITILGAAGVAVTLKSDDRALGFKLFVIAFFSVLPAWLYYQFLARRGKALWDEYVLNLFRLHVDRFAALPKPPRHSAFYRLWRQARADAGMNASSESEERTVYHKKFEGVFAHTSGEVGPSFFRGENAFPVVVTTILISVGWVVVIQPESIYALALFPAFTWTATPSVPLAELRFAFLGAYFYILQMLVRRYYQNDLKTGAYINATVRIVIVVLIVWILGSVWGTAEAQSWRFATAFAIGVFPDIGWQLLVRAGKFTARTLDVFSHRYPLDDLDGLNLWYESRLMEEGIEDLQTLVTANIVDIMLYTRIPVERLVDWIDQALLFLHVGSEAAAGAEAPRARLRRHGIRSATDLLDLYDKEKKAFRVQGIETLLNAENAKGPNVILSVLETLQREPVLYYVRQWKSFPDEYLATEPLLAEKVGRYTPTHGVIVT